MTAEVSSVRHPASDGAQRFLNFTVVDVGSRQRSRQVLRVGHRLRDGEATRLRDEVQEGTVVRVRGRLGLFGAEVELKAAQVTMLGSSVTSEEYERTRDRCRNEWTVKPDLPAVVQRMLLFEVEGTTRVDLDRWTTGLVPNIERVPIPGDDLHRLLVAVRGNRDRIRRSRPDLVLFARGGNVPDLSAWSAEALCEAIDDIQREGIPVGAAVGHRQHRPLIYEVASVDIDHPIAIADYISARNRRVEVAVARAGAREPGAHRRPSV